MKRRDLLKVSAGGLAAATAALSGCAESTTELAAVPSRPGRRGGHDRIAVGFIGTGDLGRRHHLAGVCVNAGNPVSKRLDVVAVCDVDRNHRDEAARVCMERTGRRVGVYEDFRGLLDRKDIDAVFVVTPDHWHTICAPAAKDDKGKDVPPAPVHNAFVRGRLARLIGYVGGATEVPVLAAAMKDLDVREYARQALEMNVSEEAVDALVAAIDEVGPVFLVGVVNSLARRKSAKVMPALQKAAGSADADVRMAAIEALAGFADSSSDALIVKATQSEDRAEAGRAQVAQIRLAETLRAAGDRSAAGRIFRAVLSGSAPAAQKKAARTALAAST